ncbi:alpha/beta hydrolase [Tessaracoccus lubricantis]
MHLTSTTVSVGGSQLQALTSDGDPARTFVLVHGLGVASTYFEPLAEALGRAGRLVLLNLPGFGPTPEPDRALRISQFAAMARTAAAELGVRDAVWIGHSMGAQVVVEAAAQEPGLTRRMALLSPVVDVLHRRTRTLVRQFLQSAAHEPPASAAASVRAFLSCGPRWMVETFPAMLDYPIEDRIAVTTAEVLLVAGEHDLMAPRRWLETLAERAGGPARVAVVPGAHQAMHSHADEVAELIVGPFDPEAGVATPDDAESGRGVDGGPRIDGGLPSAWSVLRSPRSVWVAAKDWTVALRDQFLSLRARDDGTPGAPGTCTGPAVVLIPGILENPRYLLPLQQWLTAQGHTVHQVPALGWNLRGLSASVTRGLDALEQLGVTDAVVVAHSKGGLIGKAMLLHPRSQGALTGMVTVATPFSGSQLWNRVQRTFLLRRSPLGLFHPEHPELAALIAEREVNSRIVSLSPAFDQMIPGGSHLDGATNVRLDVKGHFRPVSDPSVWEIIHGHVHRLAENAAAPQTVTQS